MEIHEFVQQEDRESADFATRLQAAVEPSVGEFFSELSNKVRAGLIGLSAIALLLKFGAVKTTQVAADTTIFKFEFGEGKQFYYSLAFVLVFMLALYLMRYLIDKFSWDGKKVVGDFQVLALNAELSALWARVVQMAADADPNHDILKKHAETRGELFRESLRYGNLILRIRRYLEIPFPALLAAYAIFELVR